MLLRETAARAVHLPVWETLCCGAPDHRRRTAPTSSRQALLPGVATGDVVLTPALREAGRPISAAPETTYADGSCHRPQDRRHLRRPGDRLLVPARARRPAGRGAGRRERPRRHPARVRLHRPGSRAHGRPRRRQRRAPWRRCRADPGRALRRRPLPHRRRRGRGRPRPHRRLHQGPDPVRPVARGVPGRRDADRRRLHRLAHPRPRGRERRLAARPGARRRATTWPWRRTGPAPRRRRRCAPATTCTAAWASTRPTRCTTTSRGSPTSRTRSTSAPRRCRSRTRPPRTSS